MKGFETPVDVDGLDLVFGGRMAALLPPYAQIPSEFKNWNHPWAKWQADWFYSGLKCYPVAKDGIDVNAAMRHLGAIQGSWEPKHEHKVAGVAYLASMWFTSPSGAKVAA